MRMRTVFARYVLIALFCAASCACALIRLSSGDADEPWKLIVDCAILAALGSIAIFSVGESIRVFADHRNNRIW